MSKAIGLQCTCPVSVPTWNDPESPIATCVCEGTISIERQIEKPAIVHLHVYSVLQEQASKYPELNEQVARNLIDQFTKDRLIPTTDDILAYMACYLY